MSAPACAHLLGALPVDVEEHVAARRQGRLDRRARRAVAVTVDRGVLEQPAAVGHGGKVASSMK